MEPNNGCCGNQNQLSGGLQVQESYRRKGNSPADRLLDWAVKITSVAIVAFAAYTSFQLFVPFFIAGIGIGVYDIVTKDRPIMRSIKGISGCLSNGAPVNLPQTVALAGAMGMHAAHIDHHPVIAVPFWAIIGGMLTVASIYWCYKNVRSVQYQEASV